MKRSLCWLATSLLVVSLSGCGDNGRLTNQRAEKAITQWLNTIGDSAAVASVTGVHEIPQQNTANADLTLSNFEWKSPKNDAITAYVMGPGGEGHTYNGNATAIFIHYNDGRWTLSKVITPMGSWDDLNVVATGNGAEANVQAKASPVKPSLVTRIERWFSKRASPVRSVKDGVDQFISRPNKDSCYGTAYAKAGCGIAEELSIGGWGDYYYDFLQFDLSALPDAAHTSSVELWLWASAPNDPHLKLERVTQAWTEDGLSLANNPSSIYVEDLSPIPATPGWVKVDVTALYKAWKDKQYPNFGFKLTPMNNNHTDGSIASVDNKNPDIRPKLVIIATSGH
ncbi:MAG: DNRLRE domain-containing protein [Rhodanobacter sp.]